MRYIALLVLVIACTDTTVDSPPLDAGPNANADARAMVMAFATADLNASPAAINAFIAADVRGLGASHAQAALAATCTVVGIWGDVTGDGIANIIDAQQVARYAVGLSISRPELIGNADVFDVGKINIIDAQQIARYSVGLPTTSSAGQTRCLECPSAGAQ